MEQLGNSIIIDSPQHEYKKLLKWVRDNGEKVSPRGQETREILDVVMRLEPQYAIVDGINRKLSKKLISMEALQLISQTSYVERTVKAMPNMAQFMDGGSFHGAYGPRIGAQLGAAIDKLQRDQNSRQAVITIWNPQLDAFNATTPKDIPCTTMLQFMIRDGKLVMHVTMRSNDAWWGTPHDWGQFSQLQLAVAKILCVPAGYYYHHVVSFHLYERDIEKIDTLTAPTTSMEQFTGIGEEGNSLFIIQSLAKQLLEAPGLMLANNHDETWHQKVQLRIDE
jgi:thymidylate synthase